MEILFLALIAPAALVVLGAAKIAGSAHLRQLLKSDEQRAAELAALVDEAIAQHDAQVRRLKAVLA